MENKNSQVDEYIQKASQWKEEMKILRELFLGCGFSEVIKWGAPCYMYGKTNIVIMREFKECCVLILCKGSLLSDPKGILVKPGENTQAGRQIRFTNLEEINEMKTTLIAYMQESIEIEKSGLKIDTTLRPEQETPEEFQEALDLDPDFKSAFEALTPGRQRAYLMHFAAPKQSKTKVARIKKWKDQILRGKGMND
jgi:uncharacterized protein YdeI (YjbR/CyaY-like superfamily)